MSCRLYRCPALRAERPLLSTLGILASCRGFVDGRPLCVRRLDPHGIPRCCDGIRAHPIRQSTGTRALRFFWYLVGGVPGVRCLGTSERSPGVESFGAYPLNTEDRTIGASFGRSWTRELNPSNFDGRWLDQSYGEVSFRMTRLLTAHGCFDLYLHKVNRVASSAYSFCRVLGSGLEEENSAHHNPVHCKVFESDQQTPVHRTCGPRDLVNRMPKSPASRWGGRSWISLRRLSGSRRRLVARVTIGHGEPYQFGTGGKEVAFDGCLVCFVNIYIWYIFNIVIWLFSACLILIFFLSYLPGSIYIFFNILCNISVFVYQGYVTSCLCLLDVIVQARS